MKKINILLFVTVIILLSSCKTNDWANKARYKEQNEMLKKSQQKENRIVFMGNSITEGWSNHHPGFFEGKPYINRGISGQTTDQMLERFQEDVIDLNPVAVVILAGTNDIAENRGPISLEDITKNISKMIDKAQKNNIKVVLCSVIPAYDYPWRKGLHPNEKIPKLNAMLKELAEKRAVFYLDYFSAMAKEDNALIDDYGYDGVHPNKAGYEVMEPLVEDAIKTVLKN